MSLPLSGWHILELDNSSCLPLAFQSLSLRSVYALRSYVCVLLCGGLPGGTSTRKSGDEGAGNEYYQVAAACRTAAGNRRGNLPWLPIQSPTIRDPRLESSERHRLICKSNLARRRRPSTVFGWSFAQKPSFPPSLELWWCCEDGLSPQRFLGKHMLDNVTHTWVARCLA